MTSYQTRRAPLKAAHTWLPAQIITTDPVTGKETRQSVVPRTSSKGSRGSKVSAGAV